MSTVLAAEIPETQMSDSTAISVSVAAIGAVATIAAAYLSYAKERQNERARILHDLDIVQRLPDESRAREVLQAYIEHRAVLLPLEKQFRGYAVGMLVGGASLIISGLAPKLTEITHIPIESYWLWGTSVLVLPVTIYAAYYRHFRKRLIKRFVSELGLPSDAAEPIGDRLTKSSFNWRFWHRDDR